jgi:hypothetical protein
MRTASPTEECTNWLKKRNQDQKKWKAFFSGLKVKYRLLLKKVYSFSLLSP